MDNLFDWVQSSAARQKASFPENDYKAYRGKLTSIDAKFRAGPLKFVDQLANANDGEFYTIHGPTHIEMVLRRCHELAMRSKAKSALSGYEAFLLCIAVYVHDSAMLYSRKDHAFNLQTVLLEICGKDNLILSEEEKRKVILIARAHTADRTGDRDTISTLPPSEPCGGRKVRTQLLAAILRMADQLSDDRSRSAIGKVPEASIPPRALIFHKFIGCIDSIMCDFADATVEVHLRFNASDLTKKFSGADLYLWDFLVPEIMKWFREFFYCSRFTKLEFELRSLMFSVVVYDDGGTEDITSEFDDDSAAFPVFDIATFDATEKKFEHEFYLTVDQGYPFKDDPYEMCDALQNFNANGKLDGAAMAKEIAGGN